MTARNPIVLISGSLQELPATDSIVGGVSGNTLVLETPTGSVNGTNTVFTLSQVPFNNVAQVFVNGITQKISTDYTISGTTLTFTTPPFVGAIIQCSYLNSFVSSVQTNSSTVLTISSFCTTARIVVTDANALTTSTIRAWVVSKTTGGVDELEVDPITLNANCTTNGSINFFISCPYQFMGSYNVKYTVG